MGELVGVTVGELVGELGAELVHSLSSTGKAFEFNAAVPAAFT